LAVDKVVELLAGGEPLTSADVAARMQAHEAIDALDAEWTRGGQIALALLVGDLASVVAGAAPGADECFVVEVYLPPNGFVTLGGGGSCIGSSAAGGSQRCSFRIEGSSRGSMLGWLHNQIKGVMHVSPPSYILTHAGAHVSEPLLTLEEHDIHGPVAEVMLVPRRFRLADSIFVAWCDSLVEVSGCGADATVGWLLTRLAKRCGVNPSEQILILGDRKVTEYRDAQLSACGVTRLSLLRLERKPAPKPALPASGNEETKIKVCGPLSTFDVFLTGKPTLSWLEARVAEMTGIDATCQQLFHLGKPWPLQNLRSCPHDDPALTECGLFAGSCVQVVPRANAAAAVWAQTHGKFAAACRRRSASPELSLTQGLASQPPQVQAREPLSAR
jgi:hypothetical protein